MQASSRAVQVIRIERSLQDERQQLRIARDEAAAAAQKHHDAMRQMSNRLAVAVDGAAAAECRAQACEREAAARSLEDEQIMRGAASRHRAEACAASHPPSDVRNSMAVQMHALSAKLAEAQRQLGQQAQVHRELEVAACAAEAAAAAAQREWFVRVASAASGVAAAVSPLLAGSAELPATQQVTRDCHAARFSSTAFAHAPTEALCFVGGWPGQKCTVCSTARGRMPMLARHEHDALAARR
jgi:hypothetical protein